MVLRKKIKKERKTCNLEDFAASSNWLEQNPNLVPLTRRPGYCGGALSLLVFYFCAFTTTLVVIPNLITASLERTEKLCYKTRNKTQYRSCFQQQLEGHLVFPIKTWWNSREYTHWETNVAKKERERDRNSQFIKSLVT